MFILVCVSSDISKEIDVPREELKCETMRINTLYSNFIQSFVKSFLGREEDILSQQSLGFAMESFQCGPNELLLKISENQSYIEYDLIKAIVKACGTQEDIKSIEAYTEAFNQYARRSLCTYDLGMYGKPLPSCDTVWFKLDRDQNFRLVDVNDFKALFCKFAGISQIEARLLKLEKGSVVIAIQIPSKHRKVLTTLPLFYDKMRSLKYWRTLSYKLEEEVFHLNFWTILDSCNVHILPSPNAKILSATCNGVECLAVNYTQGFSDESTADDGYIRYLDAFISGKFENLPVVKGVYYQQPVSGQENCYPMVIIEKLKELKDISLVKTNISPLAQISVLHDIISSVASFEHSKYEVSVNTDSLLVKESLDPDIDITARFCPLYGHSFCNKQVDFQADLLSSSLPLEKVQWMSDVVMLMYFNGKLAPNSELPNDHILKKMLTQKWVCVEDRFRPHNFKVLCEQIKHLLGK